MTTVNPDYVQNGYTEAMIDQMYSFDRYEKEDRADFEKTLNVFGYIPAVSTASGTVRIVVGIGALIKHIVSMALCSIVDLFKSTPNGYGYRIGKHFTYTIHDIANIIRGVVEAIPVVNLITILYDSIIGRFSYDVEYTGIHYPKQCIWNPAALPQKA